GEGRGEGRAVAAARSAISSPLLDVSIEGARGVLLNVSGGPDLTLAEVTEAAETIQAAVDPDANIYFGAVIHPRQQDDVRVTVIATGLGAPGQPSSVVRRAAPAPEPPPREPQPEPRPRYGGPDVSAPRERPIAPAPARGAELERPRRPLPGEWERERRRPTSPQQEGGEDDWDTPAFLRRPRR